MELELNGAKIRVYEDGRVERFGKIVWNAQEFTWNELKGTIRIQKNCGYQCHETNINQKKYHTSRIIYFAFNQNWEIHNSSPNNTIDHIDRNSLNNHINNLRVATMAEQTLNREYKNQKGYSFIKSRNKWQARIRINRKRIHLGLFDTEEEASIAYQTAKLKLNSV